MRLLLPGPADDVDLSHAYAEPARAGTRRSFVRCNMISSIDGAISVGGVSGTLGGPGDATVFSVLRSLADVILVGAGTVRAERYGPAVLSDEHRRQRIERGQPGVPAPIAVVTGSGELEWSSPFFTEAEARPIVVTSDEGAGRARARGGDRADVVAAGTDRVEPARAIEQLAQLGYRSVLLEGGPALNGEVVRAGLLDELCLTLSPRLVAGTGPRVMAGEELAGALPVRIIHLLEDDGFLFYRLAIDRPDGR